MAMDKINGSPLIRPGGVDKFLGTARSEKDQNAELEKTENGNGPPKAKPADTMEISDAAHQMVDLRRAVDTGRTAIEALPETREDKVAEAKKRIHQGFYNSTEVRDKIADHLGSVLSKMDEL